MKGGQTLAVLIDQLHHRLLLDLADRDDTDHANRDGSETVRSGRRTSSRRELRISSLPDVQQAHGRSILRPVKLFFPKPRLVIAALPRRMPLVTNGFSVSKGIVFLLQVMPASSNSASSLLAADADAALDIDQQQMIVAAAAHDAIATGLQRIAQRLAVARSPASA